MADQPEVLVVYATRDRQWERTVSLAPGLTIEEAILRSGLMEELPEIDLSAVRVGIFGKLKQLDTVLRSQDRIEVYRPLIADPKESRRQRVTHQQRRTSGTRSNDRSGT